MVLEGVPRIGRQCPSDAPATLFVSAEHNARNLIVSWLS